MKIYFDNPLFDGQFLRALSHSYYGCADLGECWMTAGLIQDGDLEGWYNGWFKLADRVYASAVASRDAGHNVSARNAFLRASNYYRTASVHLYLIPVDPRAVTALGRQTESFVQAARLFTPTFNSVEIPFENTTLPGYLYLPADSKSPRPTLILTGGYDGTCEETIMETGFAGIQRGYNVLTFDGPGQGRVLFDQKIYMRPDWENVIKPVVDYTLKQPGIDPKRIALVGRSFGGYLAPARGFGRTSFGSLRYRRSGL